MVSENRLLRRLVSLWGHFDLRMSFPKILALELARLGCTQAGILAFSLPVSIGPIAWHISFRTLGFAKDQIDGALRYRHPTATDFGWRCLADFAGPRWRHTLKGDRQALSGGIAIGLVAGWHTDHTFDNRGLSPDEAARQVARDVATKVVPFAERFSSDTRLLNLLVEDNEPFPWFRSQGLTRIAEIACLEARLGCAATMVPGLAEKHNANLQDQLDGVDLSEYIGGVLEAVRSGAHLL